MNAKERYHKLNLQEKCTYQIKISNDWVGEGGNAYNTSTWKAGAELLQV